MKKISCLLISLVCEAEVLNFKTCASSVNIHKKIEPKTKPNPDEKKETRKQCNNSTIRRDHRTCREECSGILIRSTYNIIQAEKVQMR